MATNDINWLGTIPTLLSDFKTDSGVRDVQLGKIYSFRPTKDSQMINISFPTQDSGGTEAIDTLGIIQYINIEGRLVGTFSEIQDSIYLLQNLANGNQIIAKTLQSPFISCNVFFPTDFTSEKRRGNIGTCVYSPTYRISDSSAHFISWGIHKGDVIKNLLTGNVATVTSVSSDTVLVLDTDNFVGASATPYALTATILVKLMSFSPNWQLPGLNYCEYTLNVVQVSR